MRKRDTAAGKPAVTLPGIVTEQDRAIVARREAGETRKAICEALGVTLGKVYHAEYACRRDAEGRARLAECPDSIKGLADIGELDGHAADRLLYHHYHHECPELEGMSSVAALGRAYVSRIHGIGPKALASIDRVIGLLGIAWSPIDRTPKPLPPKPEARQPTQSETLSNAVWDDIVARVARLEHRTGNETVLEGMPGRDSMSGVLARLSYLTGYLERAADHARLQAPADDDADQDDGGDHLETAGNLICVNSRAIVTP